MLDIARYVLAVLIWMLVASSWWPPWPVAPGRELMSSARRLGWWAEIVSYLPPMRMELIQNNISEKYVSIVSFEHSLWDSGYSEPGNSHPNQEGCASEAMWVAVLSKTSGQHLERRREAGSYHPICSSRDKSPSSEQAANIKITPMYAISDLCDPRLF